MSKKYKLKIEKGFATIYEDGKEIEPLSGIYLSNEEERLAVIKLVFLANKGEKQ